MSSSALENLLKLSKGGLKQEPPSQAEIDGLIRSAKRKRQDAAISGLGEESRFDFQCGAARALALTAVCCRTVGSSRPRSSFRRCRASLCSR